MLGKRNGMGLVVIAVIAALAIWSFAPHEGVTVKERPEGCPEGYTSIYIDRQEICSPPTCPEGYFKDERGLCIHDPYFPAASDDSSPNITVSEFPGLLLISLGLVGLVFKLRRIP